MFYLSLLINTFVRLLVFFILHIETLKKGKCIQCMIQFLVEMEMKLTKPNLIHIIIDVWYFIILLNV
jgi:hypothetical protein